MREPCFCHAVGVVSKDGMETVAAEITLHLNSVGVTLFTILNSAILVHSCHFILNSMHNVNTISKIYFTQTHFHSISKLMSPLSLNIYLLNISHHYRTSETTHSPIGFQF